MPVNARRVLKYIYFAVHVFLRAAIVMNVAGELERKTTWCKHLAFVSLEKLTGVCPSMMEPKGLHIMLMYSGGRMANISALLKRVSKT